MKTRARPVPWLPCDEAALAKLYPEYEGEVLARVFGRSVASIEGKANELRLRKSAAYKAKAYKRSRFQKGHVPANKGRKGYVAPGCEKGWFKRGEVNGRARQLWVPVGSHRINADGYLDRKVSDEPGPQTLRWKPLHRLVWAEAHGPIQEHTRLTVTHGTAEPTLPRPAPSPTPCATCPRSTSTRRAMSRCAATPTSPSSSTAAPRASSAARAGPRRSSRCRPTSTPALR